MVFTIKILVLASLASATEKENGYYVTVENVSDTLIDKYRIPMCAEYILWEIVILKRFRSFPRNRYKGLYHRTKCVQMQAWVNSFIKYYFL